MIQEKMAKFQSVWRVYVKFPQIFTSLDGFLSFTRSWKYGLQHNTRPQMILSIEVNHLLVPGSSPLSRRTLPASMEGCQRGTPEHSKSLTYTKYLRWGQRHFTLSCDRIGCIPPGALCTRRKGALSPPPQFADQNIKILINFIWTIKVCLP